jgi:TRAP-type C4-dicarboxylate transport system permease small subunit
MQATTDTWAAKLVRGLVKTIFVGCFVAFMWASIHLWQRSLTILKPILATPGGHTCWPGRSISRR